MPRPTRASLVGDNREIPVQAGSFLVDPGKSAVWWWGCTRARRCIWPMSPRSNWGRIRRSATSGWVRVRRRRQKVFPGQGEFPAVTLAIAKKPGENAVQVADQLLERVEQLKGTFIPEGVNLTVTRNYGVTANDKAMTLIT
jgi:hypothetical protein